MSTNEVKDELALVNKISRLLDGETIKAGMVALTATSHVIIMTRPTKRESVELAKSLLRGVHMMVAEAEALEE